jgi:hypothetical protein
MLDNKKPLHAWIPTFVGMTNMSNVQAMPAKVGAYAIQGVTAQHNLRWLNQKAGLSRFGPAGCLAERGIVHQGVAHHEKARSGLYCATP